MPVCHGYHIEGPYRVVHWRANIGLLLSYLTVYNVTRHIILKSTIATLLQQQQQQQQHNNNNNNNITKIINITNIIPSLTSLTLQAPTTAV